jgi:NAD(P)H-quinone oxidoreductase subunit 5
MTRNITAVLGALTMMTQTDIKRSLAYSTVSQLGFMMIQCGLGLYTLALFHIIAHGFYKAHAFLSTGTLIDDVKAPKRNLSNLGLLVSYATAITLIVAGRNSLAIYFGILALALTQVIGSRKELLSGVVKNFVGSLAYIAVGVGIYVGFEHFGGSYLSRVIPQKMGIDAVWVASVALVFALFSLGIYLAKRMQNLNEPTGKRLWVFFWNGGYIPHISSRFFNGNF